ncbi:FAD/NAD(P)-binding protein [Sphingobium aquiterrae]|uniref:FAD/NAD(P)-binding protein n=1 Tax=Sphingobium aquiterrae TaxID=2038656 RepID=UPI0030161F63
MTEGEAIGLPMLEARLMCELMLIGHAGTDWTRPRIHEDGHVHDVVIVGGGQSGLAAAFGLLRERIGNILVIDDGPEGYEGPWETYARMVTLRTPKDLTPIDYGVPSLSYRAWWEAQHGRESWAALERIARGDWMAYLRWYRRVLALPVRNDHRLTMIEPMPQDGLHRLHIANGVTFLTRKVVLATGIQGGGQWHTPPMIAQKLSRELYAHSSEPIDYAAMVGRRIGILGGGASAFDNANWALGLGAAAVEVFVRRETLPRINPIRFMERQGFTARYPALDDETKYRVMAGFLGHNQPPTNDTFARAAAWPGFALHLGAPWLDVEEVDGPDGGPDGRVVRVTTPQGRHDFDFVVLSTGLVSDPALRPELALVANGIARWRDRVTPPAAVANPLIDAHPYLGEGFELMPRAPEDSARVHGLFAFNYSALISLGLSASALSGLKNALPRLVAGVANQLFLDDKDQLVADLLAYDEPEFLGEWPRPDAREAAA